MRSLYHVPTLLHPIVPGQFHGILAHLPDKGTLAAKFFRPDLCFAAVRVEVDLKGSVLSVIVTCVLKKKTLLPQPDSPVASLWQ